MIRSIILIFSVSLGLTSCSIHGSFQGLYSYYSQTKAKIPGVLIETDSATAVCNLKNTKEPKVYIVNGTALKKCISNYPNAVVYIWKPKCHGSMCYSLNTLQERCNLMNKELFIVADYYDSEMMGLTYKTQKPIFAIDTKHYKSNRTTQYLSGFLYDLTSKKNVTGSIISFKNGAFFQSCTSLDSLL